MYVTRLSLLNTGIDKLLHVDCVCVILNVCSTLFKDKQKKSITMNRTYAMHVLVTDFKGKLYKIFIVFIV